MHAAGHFVRPPSRQPPQPTLVKFLVRITRRSRSRFSLSSTMRHCRSTCTKIRSVAQPDPQRQGYCPCSCMKHMELLGLLQTMEEV
jgi:hypothetical protein